MGRGILFLPDRIGNDHIIETAEKEHTQDQSGNDRNEDHHQGEFCFQFHISEELFHLSCHYIIFSLNSDGEYPVYFLKLFPK